MFLSRRSNSLRLPNERALFSAKLNAIRAYPGTTIGWNVPSSINEGPEMPSALKHLTHAVGRSSIPFVIAEEIEHGWEAAEHLRSAFTSCELDRLALSSLVACADSLSTERAQLLFHTLILYAVITVLTELTWQF